MFKKSCGLERLCRLGRGKDGFPNSVSVCLRDVPLWKHSVTEVDLQLLQLRDASSDVNCRAREGSFRYVFSCVLCFSSVIFSIMALY